MALGVVALGFLLASDSGAQGRGPAVLATTVDHTITPVIAGHLDDGIERAAREGYEAYLIRLDTPGGLDTSMRAIVQDILASRVPVVVYVSPRGGRAASAGAVITFASHVAAMAPGTAIGAATPISGEDGSDLEDKVVNDAIAYVTALAELRDRDVEFARDTVADGRSASAREAVEVGAVDLLVGSEDELLTVLDGRRVDVGEDTVVLSTADARVDEHDLGFFRGIQQQLADPNIAYLLLSIGTLGLVYELATPGIGAGAAVGLTCILLALAGLAVLPIDAVGLLFLLLAASLFVAEVVAPGLGVAAGGGALALVLSGLFLFEDVPGLQLSLAVVLPTAVVVGGFVVVAGRLALRTRSDPSTTTGLGLLVGQRSAVRALAGTPQVFVNGAWWSARPVDPVEVLHDGSEVEVVDVDGLQLVVDPRSPHDGRDPAQEGET